MIITLQERGILKDLIRELEIGHLLVRYHLILLKRSRKSLRIKTPYFKIPSILE